MTYKSVVNVLFASSAAPTLSQKMLAGVWPTTRVLEPDNGGCSPAALRATIGPIYRWMLGDPELARNQAYQELANLPLPPGYAAVALDLGAGVGYHSLALAALGYRVLAIDTCATLLAELQAELGAAPITTIVADFRQFRLNCVEPIAVALCLGDTLTHLADLTQVQQLAADLTTTMVPGGVFVATFRDYSGTAPVGIHRFIPVRQDQNRLLTCFLEYHDTTVTVTDLLYERLPVVPDATATDNPATGWQFRGSSYPKIRLQPAWVSACWQALGWAVQLDSGPRGMVRLLARK